MKVYIVMLQDRHIAPVVEVWADKDKAIADAREIAKDEASLYEHRYVEEELTPMMKRSGWLYYACFSSEGDSVHVQEVELHD